MRSDVFNCDLLKRARFKQASRSSLKRGWFIQTALVVCVSILLIGTASACNIPVFRYALERWKPDNVKVIVFQEGMLPKEDMDQLRSLLGESANAEIVVSDVTEPLEADLEAIWFKVGASGNGKLPYVIVQSSSRDGKPLVGWQGSLEQAPSAHFSSSPIRQEIAKRLIAGDAVVWLLIRGNDEVQNEKVRTTVRMELDQLQQSIEFPDGLGLPGSELYSEVPLLMQFSILELDANDPAEAYLLNSLGLIEGKPTADGEPVSTNFAGPVLVPIFGRGRVLDVLSAEQIHEDRIEGLTRYLCAACSCQVKEQNPGFDLLMPIDWNSLLFGESGRVPETSAGLKRDQPQKPVLIPLPPGRKK